MAFGAVFCAVAFFFLNYELISVAATIYRTSAVNVFFLLFSARLSYNKMFCFCGGGPHLGIPGVESFCPTRHRRIIMPVRSSNSPPAHSKSSGYQPRPPVHVHHHQQQQQQLHHQFCSEELSIIWNLYEKDGFLNLIANSYIQQIVVKSDIYWGVRTSILKKLSRFSSIQIPKTKCLFRLISCLQVATSTLIAISLVRFRKRNTQG